MTVYEALNNVMRDVQAVGKRERNNHFNFNFRGIDAVVNAVGPALREHGVIIAPTATVAEYREVHTAKGKPSQQAILTVDFGVWGPDGDSMTVQVVGEAWDEGDKGTSKAHSVAYRIALLQLLCIPTDEPDPDSMSYERAAADAGAKSRAALLEAVGGDRNRAATVWSQTAAAERPITVEEWQEIAATIHPSEDPNSIPAEAEMVDA